MNLQELKKKPAAELLAYAEELKIENASNLRKQDMMFAILKQLAANNTPIFGSGVIEVYRTGLAFYDQKNPTIYQAPMIFMYHLAKLENLVLEQVILLKVKFDRRRKVNVILLCSKSIKSILKSQIKLGIVSISTT